MGAEQSNNRNVQQHQPQMSEAQVKRLLEAQRQQYEKKLEEVAAKEAAKRQQQEKASIEAAKRKLQEEAVNAAQRKLQEEAAKTAAQSSIQRPQTSASVLRPCTERDRAIYSYLGNQLQQTTASAPPASPPVFNVYPNLNQMHSSPTNGQYINNQNNPFYSRPPPPQDFVFVNNNGQTESFRPAPAVSTCTPPRGPQRPRSVSRTGNTPGERDVLDCPTCHTRYGMKIFQCDNGHSSCNNCKIRGRACGICRMSLTNRRNFDLENHISQTKAPCPHTSEGCKLSIKIADMDSHVKECPFKEQDCPLAAIFGTCRWKGKLSQMSNHFDSMHPNGRQTNVDTEMQLTNVCNNSQQVHLVVLGVYNFLIHLKVSENDGKVYFAVQLIGTKVSAMKWLYEIHVYNKSEHRRKYLYIDNCSSSNDNIDDVFKAGECAVLPVWYATTFLCNGALSYKFFIKKTNEEKKFFGKNYRGRGKNH